jgi:hypothetical protein
LRKKRKRKEVGTYINKRALGQTDEGSRVNERPAVRRGSGSTIKKFQRKKNKISWTVPTDSPAA